MSLLDGWGKRRPGSTIPTKQKIAACLESELHNSFSNHVKEIIRTCGGLGDGETAVAHQTSIIATARVMLNPPALVLSSPHANTPLKRGYEYAQARYLQKRLEQIQATIAPRHYPQLVELDRNSRQNIQESNAQLNDLLKKHNIKLDTSRDFEKSSRLSSAESAAQRLKEDCAELRERLNQFTIKSNTPVEVQLDSTILAFIRKHPANVGGTPSPSGTK